MILQSSLPVLPFFIQFEWLSLGKTRGTVTFTKGWLY